MRHVLKLVLALLFALPVFAQHNGTVNGTVTFGPVKFGNGTTSTSDSNYIRLPSGSFSSGTSFTTEAWLRTTATSLQVAVGAGYFGETTEAWMGVNAAGHFGASINIPFATGSFAGSETFLDSGITINDGALHHCAMVMSGGTNLYLLVDGVRGATFTGTLPNGGVTDSSGFMGRDPYTGGAAWTSGAIDEVANWNYARYTAATYTVPSAAYVGNETNLLSLYHLQADGTDSYSAVTATAIDPSNSAILYSPYNWNVVAGAASTVNAGAYLRTIFSGTSAALTFNTSTDASPYPQLWARVDNQAWTQLGLGAGNPTVAVATGLPNRKHLLEVVVKSTTTSQARWSSPATLVQITGLVIDSGGTVTAPVRRSKNILIYGDSITEGFRSIGTTSPDTDGSDILGCYSYALGTAVDAEVGIVAFSGTGILTAGNGSVPALTSTYNLLYSGVARSFSPAPDLVVYNESTNDSSSITSAFTTVVNAVQAAVPTTRQLLLVPFNGGHASEIAAVVTAAANPRITSASTTGWFNSADSVDGTHPFGYASVGLIAPRLFPLVQALLYPATSTGSSRSYTFY